MQDIEFGHFQAANDWRHEPEEYLCPDYRRATKMMILRREMPNEVIEDARTKALASRESDRRTYGQAKLSEDVFLLEPGSEVPESEGFEDHLELRFEPFLLVEADDSESRRPVIDGDF